MSPRAILHVPVLPLRAAHRTAVARSSGDLKHRPGDEEHADEVCERRRRHCDCRRRARFGPALRGGERARNPRCADRHLTGSVPAARMRGGCRGGCGSASEMEVEGVIVVAPCLYQPLPYPLEPEPLLVLVLLLCSTFWPLAETAYHSAPKLFSPSPRVWPALLSPTNV